MKTEIPLPIEMADGLTLEEIGAIFILMALPHLDKNSEWFLDEKLLELLNYFEQEGIVVSTDDKLNVEIDLTWL